jgi:hypothetical protein
MNARGFFLKKKTIFLIGMYFCLFFAASTIFSANVGSARVSEQSTLMQEDTLKDIKPAKLFRRVFDYVRFNNEDPESSTYVSDFATDRVNLPPKEHPDLSDEVYQKAMKESRKQNETPNPSDQTSMRDNCN